MTSSVTGVVSGVIKTAVFVVFGLLLFYSTRVGDYKPVYRFSVITLIVLVVPSLYIILANFAAGFPLHDQIASQSELFILACIALGYGVPYTFLSGFEVVEEDNSEDTVVEGGIMETINSDEEETAEEDALESDEKTSQEEKTQESGEQDSIDE